MPKSKRETRSSRRGTVSITVKLDPDLVDRLDKATSRRKDSREFPFFQRDIVAAALLAWLNKNEPEADSK